MIYVTGDTHAERMHFLNYRIDPGWTANDIHIVCGDWGFLLRDNEAEHQFLDLLEQRLCTFCFVDGNHENFPAISRYPEEIWNGGRIHRIRRNVIHLMRGQVFTLQGKKIFVPEEAVELFGYAETVPAAYYQMLQGKLDLLKASGMVICPAAALEEAILTGEAKSACAPAAYAAPSAPVKMAAPVVGREENISKRIVTERDLATVYAPGVTVVHVSKKAILTDLAREYAANRGVSLVKDI